MVSRADLPAGVAANLHRFSGRAWLLPRICAWLDGDRRMLLITGDPGAGKSMVAAWLAAGPSPRDPSERAQLDRIRARIKAIHFCSVAAGNTAPRDIAGHLAAQLTRTVPGFGAALAETLSDRVSLVANVAADPIFAALHIVGERYDHRDAGPHKLTIPTWAFEARTLTALCKLYDLTEAEILNHNRTQPWVPDLPLADGTAVGIPDTEWTALLATHFAAEVIAAPTLARRRRIALLQRLVPIATSSPTALDTALARLLLAAAPSDPVALQKLQTLVSLDDPPEPITKFEAMPLAWGDRGIVA